MKQPRKIPGILIYLLILFFSVIGFVYALHSNVKEGYKQVVNLGGSKKTTDGVEVSKIIEETKLENYFDITLTVKTQTKIDEILTDQDLAIVVVMDVSNSMNTATKTGETRREAARAAANDFIDTFASYSSETAAARELGFVAFNTDAHKIFDLQENKSTTQATALKNEMETDTEAIYNQKDYDDAHSRFTNIEGGLQMAYDMLEKSDIQNKYIIFLSDGLPTTYLNRNSDELYDGYDPYMDTNPGKSSEGYFYNEITDEPCTYGTSYSDRAAIDARDMAISIKNDNITVFSIGVGLDDQSLPSTEKDKTNNFSIVDTETTDYEVGNNIDGFKNWLKFSIGSGYYYDANSTDALKEAYAQIFEKVKQMTEEASQATWVAEDPMGVDGDVESIQFVGFFDDESHLQNELSDKYEDKTDNPTQSDTASISNGNKINWDLKNSSYTTSLSEDGKTTYYHYSVKYRVRIENELDSFSTEKIYDTNGVTKLTYVTRNNGVLSENKEVEFPIPSVVAYLGEFSFTKKSASFDVIESGILAGAEFTLTHHKDCPCMVESDTNHIHMPETQSYKAVSGTDGKVTFTNIPSGHDYLLKETKAPDNYTASKTTKKINIAYGKVTGNPSNTEYENNIKTGDLKIAKTVEGNKDYSGEFEFKIVVKFDKTTLTGTYDYSLFDTSGKETTGKLKLTDTFKLKDGEYIIIKDLPINSTYEITELTTNGYTVKHTINSESRVTGKTATCSSNSCSIDSEDTQEVNFYNIAGYILPATGDSGMLILIIIASLLIIGPIIDIGYMFYKYRKEDKLTS